MVCLHGKLIVIIASETFSLPSQLTFTTKFHLTFSSIFLTISGAQLKEWGY